MFKYFLILFIFVPLLELYVLIEVGSGIGGLATVALCLLTAALGGLLIRWQGIKTLLSAQQSLSRGEFPAKHGMHGIMIGLAGLLLFTPGFITDALGFLLLMPIVRNLLIHRFLPTQSARQSSVVIDAEIIHSERHLP